MLKHLFFFFVVNTTFLSCTRSKSEAVLKNEVISSINYGVKTYNQMLHSYVGLLKDSSKTDLNVLDIQYKPVFDSLYLNHESITLKNKKFYNEALMFFRSLNSSINILKKAGSKIKSKEDPRIILQELDENIKSEYVKLLESQKL